MNPELSAVPNPVAAAARVKVFGVGSAGVALLRALDFAGADQVAVDTDAASLATFSGAEKILLETKVLRGLGTGGDPERGRELAEAHYAQLKSACAGAEVIFVFAGLGGGAGTGIAPVLARAANDAGALALAFVTLPFECEGSRRQAQARAGLELLKAAADGVIALPCQKVAPLIDANTSLLDTFKATTQILLEGARGVWRLLTQRGLIPLHFADLNALLRDRHAECWFAAVQASGPARASDVVTQLCAHPMMDGGEVIAQAESAVVSLVGGPDLSLADVNGITEQLQQRNPRLHLMLGAVVEEQFRERLSLTLIATRSVTNATAEEENELLRQATTRKPAARTPAPVATPMAESSPPASARPTSVKSTRNRKNVDRMRQGQLPLDIVNKSRFDKTEATILNGEDLDVPTYIRRGVALN